MIFFFGTALWETMLNLLLIYISLWAETEDS